MAYKAKTWNRDITAPGGVSTLYSQPVPGAWSVYGTENLLPWSGLGSAVRDYKQRGWNTFAGWKEFRATNGYLPSQQMYESHLRHNQLHLADIVFTRLAPPAMKYVATGWRMQVLSMLVDGRPGWKYTQSQTDKILWPVKDKCLQKARDMKVNAAVALGEGRKTVQMIADTARKLGTAYSAFRKGNFKKVAKTLGVKKPTGEAANNWLAWSYGWSPLLSDTKGLAELAAQHLALGGRGPRIKVRSSHAEGSGVDAILATNQGTTWLNGSYRVTGDWVYQAKAGLLLELEYEGAAFAAQLGFGVTDPALLAWELIPFSFVFDWFVDVGSYLESASSLQGWRVIDGWASLKQTFDGEQTFVNARGWTTPYESSSKLPYVPMKQTHYSRVAWSGSAPTLRTPLWDGLNARRLTTVAALYRQLCIDDRKPGRYPVRGKWTGRLPDVIP